MDNFYFAGLESWQEDHDMKYSYDENDDIEIKWELNAPIEYRLKEHPESGWMITPLQEHPHSDPFEDVEEWIGSSWIRVRFGF